MQPSRERVAWLRGCVVNACLQAGTNSHQVKPSDSSIKCLGASGALGVGCVVVVCVGFVGSVFLVHSAFSSAHRCFSDVRSTVEVYLIYELGADA